MSKPVSAKRAAGWQARPGRSVLTHAPTRAVLWFRDIGLQDLPHVGGKNASLGQMTRALAQAGVCVPDGFAVTAQAYRRFMAMEGLGKRIAEALRDLDVEQLDHLRDVASRIRGWILAAPLPPDTVDAIRDSYAALGEGKPVAVAVRSSATAEDLPDASFAGQQETFLNVRGADAVVAAVQQAYASLYTDRAIAYRQAHGYAHERVALSAGVQRMVRSDLAAAGVAFTLDTESGFDQVVLLTSAFGLGETVVKGEVNPDEFVVFKPALAAERPAILRRTLGTKQARLVYADGGGTRLLETTDVERKRFSLTDEEVMALARQALLIEKHYGRPMDIEWAKDGEDGRLYILQARPETVQSRAARNVIERFRVVKPGATLVNGQAVGQRAAAGRARVVHGIADLGRVQPGDVLVAEMTDPDWGPVMKRVNAIVTDRGGRACHAAIVAREAGIPAVVGCLDATTRIPDGAEVTVSCAEGQAGHVYAGRATIEVEQVQVDRMPSLPVQLMMNLGDPGQAFRLARLPGHGVGLARIEFIINRTIGIHPQALLHPERVTPEVRAEIAARTAAYPDPVTFYVHKLAEGIATLAAAFAPRPVIVRTSDFKSNEYGNLLGGQAFEPEEENPMIGLRGAARYISEDFRDCFALECRALKLVRDEMGLVNLQVMIPFLRTIEEAHGVVNLLAANGLKRGENGLKLITMCEIPSNALSADAFLDLFDGFSIGSNDLTQLTLGVDRDSAKLAGSFDERDPAVKALMHMAIQACRRRGKYIGICGQGPSDHPDLARWLLGEGIDSISLNPDSVLPTWLFLANMESEAA